MRAPLWGESTVHRYKIAVVATEYMTPYLERNLEHLRADCTFQICCYRPFWEAEAVCCLIPKHVDAILTAGNLFAESVRQALGDPQQLIRSCEIDETAVHRLLWKLCRGESGALDRIYVDFFDLLGLNITQFQTVDAGISLSERIHRATRENPERTLALNEEAQYRRLLEIWQTGAFDVLVTRYSGLIPMLRAQGVRVCFPFPSVENLRNCCREIVQELELRRLQNGQAAAVHVNLWLTDPRFTVESVFEQQCAQLAQEVREFLGGRELGCLIRRSHFGIELITDCETVYTCTNNLTTCRLAQYLNQRLPFRVFVGYGLGENLYQARLNAINAIHEAEVSGGSFLINQRDELFGPLGETAPRREPAANFAFLTSEADISMAVAQKVLQQFDSTRSGQRITAVQLAQNLGVSRRTANRYLNAMCQAGLLELCSEERGVRGRPTRVYGRRGTVGE